MCSAGDVNVGICWNRLVWRTPVQSRFLFSRMPFDANVKATRPCAGAPRRVRFHFPLGFLVTLVLFASFSLFAQSRPMYISKHYLNIPVARASQMQIFQIQVDRIQKREFPVQVGGHSAEYWIFIDVSEFRGQT